MIDELTGRGPAYAVAVDPIATAYPATAVPVTPAYGRTGRRPEPRHPDPPVDLKTLTMAAGRSAGKSVVRRHGTHQSTANRHPRLRRPGDLHQAPPHPTSPRARPTLYAALRHLHHPLAVCTGHRHTRRQHVQTRTPRQNHTQRRPTSP
ncbi:transposase [Actinosynnema sp. NPDC047251]|uniref:Transposase IS701-like DDE domain-containing protein n=1 Tax=Saccharothrix espanaensis (strain ATCC 51144 / DSM 44229 / JCM 9112 / NBRC 15066 / NRRL 15764) TaxID=1179773 RepID=K0JYS3_SACES|nr:hypothetical protein BN6_31320 [Saccharothrix espanaensis DSM 44229]